MTLTSSFTNAMMRLYNDSIVYHFGRDQRREKWALEDYAIQLKTAEREVAKLREAQERILRELRPDGRTTLNSLVRKIRKLRIEFGYEQEPVECECDS